MSPLVPGSNEAALGRWWTLGGVEMLDVMSSVEQLLDQGRTVHIGTDAQQSSRRMEFVTVLCALNPGKGGRVFYTRQFAEKDMSLFDKLSMETWLSLELALRMNAEFDLPSDKKRIWVHVDANPDTRFDSSSYVKQLAGMVAGSGFPVLVKPDAWCASHVADFAVKNKHRRVLTRG
ncbi:MAG: ribonuclease H-like YkuK family protein [Myxococcota bacterium]|jgi:predicted RNase H-related nuclease YkuK (DUF458 family)|nr:ribonuclease H-like YkuK family protein [Myxococcota bacterium]